MTQPTSPRLLVSAAQCFRHLVTFGNLGDLTGEAFAVGFLGLEIDLGPFDLFPGLLNQLVSLVWRLVSQVNDTVFVNVLVDLHGRTRPTG